MSKISVIVLTYNSCEQTTIPCIESLLKYQSDSLLEIILVDNASADETPEVLKKYHQTYPSLFKLILNDKNLGYSEGNNCGIRIANGDFIILLNNDTAVTKNWLDTIIAPFSKDPMIGLVSTVSNSVGNEQQLRSPTVTLDNYESFGSAYTSKRTGKFFYTDNLGFFCVAISKRVVDEIGHLDSSYGIGMFEDTDYCVRAINKGYRLAVSEDTFIFHSGSYSFKKLSSTEYQTLFKKNFEYFIAKNRSEWGITQIAINFWNKINADIHSYRDRILSEGGEIPSEIEDVLYRTESQTALLSMLKKLEKNTQNIDYAKILNG